MLSFGSDRRERTDEDTAARRAESELLLADVERANARVSEMERRNVSPVLSVTSRHLTYNTWVLQEKLRAEVEAAKSGSEDQER